MYKEYNLPKTGLFSLPKENGEYKLPDGWEQELKELSIIGEDSILYAYKHPNGIGHVNKSRLIKWVPTQMSLF